MSFAAPNAYFASHSLFEAFSVNPGEVVLRPTGQILVMAKTMGEIVNGFDAVCPSSGDQGHAHIPNFGPIEIFVIERAGEIAHGYDQRLFDNIRIEGDIGVLIKLGQSRPLVDNEGQRFPQGGIGLDEAAFELLVTHLFELFHQGFGMLSVKKHPLDGGKTAGLGLIVIVENLLVDCGSSGVLGWIVVLDGSEFEICVSVTGGLDELVSVLVVKILGRAVRYLGQLRLGVLSMFEQLVNDFPSVMTPRIEQDDDY